MAEERQVVYVERPGSPEKSYLSEAFITLILYYVGFFIAGLIANIIFLNNAKRDRSQGVTTTNVGCLQVLLWVQIIGLVVGCVAMIVFGGFGLLLALLGLE